MSAPKRRPADDVGPNAGGPLGDAAAVWLPLDALAPHPKNPRVHGAEVTRLARTILRTAWGAPIVAQWRASGRHRVIAGHGRLLAAREILAGVEVDGELRGGAEHRFDPAAPAPGLLPVRVVRVSDAEADAMTLADNARGIQGEDSAELIVEMAAQFGRDAAVMADIGFDGAALDALVKGAGDALLGAAGGGDDTERHEVIGDGARERVEVEEDEAPVDRAEELRAKWNTAAGQLWEIPSATVSGGVHRILCGDSTKAEDVARVMGDDVGVWCWTDPPYAEYLSHFRRTWGSLYAEWGRVRGSGRKVINGKLEGVRSYFDNAHSTMRDVWEFPRVVGDDRYGHATPKPVAAMARAIVSSSPRGGVVVEPFSGSGTTLVAAEQTGRLCRAIELAPKYVAVALERLSVLGLTPQLVS